jgi:hypothetical protein
MVSVPSAAVVMPVATTAITTTAVVMSVAATAVTTAAITTAVVRVVMMVVRVLGFFFRQRLFFV